MESLWLFLMFPCFFRVLKNIRVDALIFFEISAAFNDGDNNLQKFAGNIIHNDFMRMHSVNPCLELRNVFPKKRRSFGARSAETVKSNLETSIPTYIIRDRKSSQSAFPLAGQPDPFFFIFREGATGRTAFFFQVLPWECVRPPLPVSVVMSFLLRGLSIKMVNRRDISWVHHFDHIFAQNNVFDVCHHIQKFWNALPRTRFAEESWQW